MNIYYSKEFVSQYKKLPKSVKIKFEKRELIFRTNQFDPRLKTHRLIGKWKGYYSFSLDYQYRIIFNFETEDEIWFHFIGTHSIYK